MDTLPVVKSPTGRTHAVYAGGGPLDGSLYGFQTLCGKLIEIPDLWPEQALGTPVTCRTCQAAMLVVREEHRVAGIVSREWREWQMAKVLQILLPTIERKGSDNGGAGVCMHDILSQDEYNDVRRWIQRLLAERTQAQAGGEGQ